MPTSLSLFSTSLPLPTPPQHTNADQKRLKSLGEEVSDAEDDDDGEGEGADEDEE